MAGLIVGLGALFIGLNEANRLKAPAFANRLTFDEKMRLLRDAPPQGLRILLVGSSTTLHGVDGELLRHSLRLGGALANLGVQDLRINQTRFLTDQFLSIYPDVTQVIMVSTMLDYKGCASTPARFFNPEQVKRYLSKAMPALFYHFKYFDLEGVVKRAADIQDLRRTTADLDSGLVRRLGRSLLDVPRDRIDPRIWEGLPISLDPACYESLHALVEDLHRFRRAFTYVIAPMRPGYLAYRDRDGTLLAEHRRHLQEQLAGTGTLVIDAHATLQLPDEAFFDAYHLNPSWAQQLTRYIGEQMGARSVELEHGRAARQAARRSDTYRAGARRPGSGDP